MKIAIITSGLLPVPAQKGGAVENLIDYYIQYNEKVGMHDFTVYSVKPPRPVQDGRHVRYHFVDAESFFYRMKRKLYVRGFKQEYYDAYLQYFLHTILKDVVAGNYDRILLENRPGYVLELSRHTQVPLLVHLHTDTMYAGGIELDKVVCEKASKILTVSDYIKSRVLSIGVEVCAKSVINGIDCARFFHAEAVPRSKVGFTDDDFVVVYFGRVDKIKGVRELLMAMKGLMDLPKVKLLIIGANSFSNSNLEDDYALALKALAEAMPGKVSFTGFVPYDQMPSYLKTCDVAVLPSLCDDACPLSVIEAMACGLPMVSTVAGGIPELCGDAAILFERNEQLVENLSSAIRHLYEDTAYCKQVSLQCLERSKQFDKDLFAEKFLREL